MNKLLIQYLKSTPVSIVLLMLFVCRAQAVMFLDIWEYKIGGNTLLPEDLVIRTVSPYLGVGRTIEDVDKAAKALQQEYRIAGFATVVVSVPEQDVVNGIVQLKVTEAKVRRVTISGSRYFTLSGIRDNIPSLQENEVIHLPSLQKDLQVANQYSQDLTLVPVIQQGPTPETVDVELQVSDEAPIHGGVSLSNYHSENTTEQRLSLELSYKNLWQKSHQLSLQYQVSPENTDEVNVLATSYLMPIDKSGKKLAIYGVASDSELAAVNDINVIGKGFTLGGRYVNPFKQTPREVHSFSLGGDYKDFDEDLVLIDGSVQSTPISYTSWTAQYSMFYQGGTTTDEFSAGVSFGVRGIGNDNDEFNNKRSVASPNFQLLSLDWRRSYRFGQEWMLSHRVRGQLSDSSLVSNEQISAGGVGTVRGYYESQIQGDLGWIANIEFSTPNFAKQWKYFDNVSGVLFFDAAKLRLRNALPGQEDSFSISSTGLGLRLGLFKQLDVNVDSGVALEDYGSVEKDSLLTRARMSLEF